jgi:hypothetical protein
MSRNAVSPITPGQTILFAKNRDALALSLVVRRCITLAARNGKTVRWTFAADQT